MQAWGRFNTLTYIMKTMTPRLQLSAVRLYPPLVFESTSGATNNGVPHRV